MLSIFNSIHIYIHTYIISIDSTDQSKEIVFVIIHQFKDECALESPTWETIMVQPYLVGTSGHYVTILL